MVTGNTGDNVGNFGICHQLGIFYRLTNGLRGSVDIGHHTCTQAARRALAQADNVDFIIFPNLAD